MTDFESHLKGTAEEIRLSRALANEIQQSLEQWGDVLPHNVRIAYNKLYGFYIKQIQDEEMR
jgi:hypothetical protein